MNDLQIILQHKDELLDIEDRKFKIMSNTSNSKLKLALMLLAPMFVLTIIQMILGILNISILSMGNLLEFVFILYAAFVVYPNIRKINRMENAQHKILEDEIYDLIDFTNLETFDFDPMDVDLGELVTLLEDVMTKHENIEVIRLKSEIAFVKEIDAYLFYDKDTKTHFQVRYLSNGEYFEYLTTETGTVIPV